MTRRYHKRVHRDREWLAREERKARGEQTEQERWAELLARRVQGKPLDSPQDGTQRL